MNHEELFVCVSVVTIIPFFNSIIEISNQSVKELLHFFESHESVVRNEYKSPPYKLWQYVTKDKPSLHNDSAFCSNNKKYSPAQQISTSYPYSPKRFKQSENYRRQLAFIVISKRLLFKSNFPFYKYNNYDTGCGFVSYICLASRILAYVKSQIYDCKKYSKLNDFALRICGNVVKQQTEKLRKFNTCISKIFYRRMYYLWLF